MNTAEAVLTDAGHIVTEPLGILGGHSILGVGLVVGGIALAVGFFRRQFSRAMRSVPLLPAPRG